MIQLLITVVVFAIVCYILFWLLGYLAVPEPIRKVVVVVVVLIAVIWILSNFLPGTVTGFHPLWGR
jgi:hypothetical protein